MQGIEYLCYLYLFLIVIRHYPSSFPAHLGLLPLAVVTFNYKTVSRPSAFLFSPTFIVPSRE